ncbi:MAG TPA: hypothetical protein PJ982_04180 [Lacipirellulaceae bacterium]|nr:hypothetical protein [Lacipirellulaceae bacterium]
MLNPSPKDLHRAVEAARAEVKRLEAEREEIIAQSTESRLEANRLALQTAHAAHFEVQRLLNSAVAATGQPAGVDDLRAENERLALEMQSLSQKATRNAGFSFPSRLVRLDAVEFAASESQSTRDELAKLEARINTIKRTGNQAPGPRLLARRRELLDALEKFDRDAELARTGEKLARLRELSAANAREIERLQAEHRAKLVAEK